MLIKFNNYLFKIASPFKNIKSYFFHFSKDEILYFSNTGIEIYFYIDKIKFVIFNNGRTEEGFIIRNLFSNFDLYFNRKKYKNIFKFLNKSEIYDIP